VAGKGELISIKVKPRSARSAVEIGSDGGLVVRVHAPAAAGAANRELLGALAKALGVPKSAVRIVRGEKGRWKQISVAELSAEEARARLREASKGKSRGR